MFDLRLAKRDSLRTPATRGARLARCVHLAALLFAVCLFAVIPSGYAIVWAARRLSPGRVGILMMSEVLVAVVSATLLAGEFMGVGEWMGAVLIIGAAVLEVTSGEVRQRGQQAFLRMRRG